MTTKPKHTPGPWAVLGRIGKLQRIALGPDKGTAGSYTVAEVGPFEGGNALVNAARIVACVNSLEGIENPAAWVAAAKEALRGRD